ncbi:hypothetical protein [Nakamurella antarctica]|uniref:hypothetical protein n=1 Tax=Nakamurella antarctica TaxID=1902245 RepID=UPI0013DDF522|nr:hypothetical protein [Nakamurella antarctica]
MDVTPDGMDWKVTLRVHGKHQELPLLKCVVQAARIPQFQTFSAYAKQVQEWSLSQDPW